MSVVDRIVNLFVKFDHLRDYLTESYPVFSPFVVPSITLVFGFAVVFTIVFGGIAMVRIAEAVSKYISSLNDPEPSPSNANPYAPYPDISGLFTSKDLPKLKSAGSALFNSTDTTTSRPAPAPTASSTVPVPATYWAPDPCPTEGTWARQCTVPRQADLNNGGHVYYKTMESEYVPYNQPNGRRARLAHEERVAREQANARQEQNTTLTPFGSNNGAANNAFRLAAEAATKGTSSAYLGVVDKETGAIPRQTASTFGQSRQPSTPGARATGTETSKPMEFGGAKPRSPPTPSSFGNISTYRPAASGGLKRSNMQASVVEISEVD
ncbi:hypothetical protein F5Y02DRAFT_403704 [Annulohypoxylon stygium]|nr:hypothetical protein F5Y02DRAFT_403704 [Annulohypoxylon stygium]